MTDYTKSTNFASKDSLPSGNALKIVKGTEIDTEFNNIATAIATKADLVSPTFTGTPAAPTALSGTSSTQLATTAFVQTALQVLYPVGSIYINASVSTNPGTLLGFGTWVALSAGRMLLGAGTNSGNTFTAGTTGGSYVPSMPSHTHSITDSGHSHSYPLGEGYYNQYTAPAIPTNTYANRQDSTQSVNSSTTGISINAASSGDTALGNLPPYLTVYMWQRTA